MSKEKDEAEIFEEVKFDDEEPLLTRHFAFNKKHLVRNYYEVATKILKCLRDHGPVENMPYYSNPEKEFSAVLGAKYNQKDRIRRKAIVFTTTRGGKGSSWKLDDRNLQHMLKHGDKYGIEGINNTKGTYHSHALEPLINYFIDSDDIPLSLKDFDIKSGK